MNTDFARRQMIEQQVRAWEVFDENVLSALKSVPRELFVDDDAVALAFADAPIPIGHGQMMMTPTLEGRVLQALQLEGGERVLEIGTGSGFLTAVLAKMSGHVTSIDIYGDFLDTAGTRLTQCNISNVDLVEMNGMHELPAGTFDAIAITGSVQILDSRFTDALSLNGRLFAVVGNAPAMSATQVIRCAKNEWQSDTLFETDLAPLVDGALAPQFSF